MNAETILTASVKLAETLGYRNVLKRHVAKALGCGMGTVNYHFGTMDELRRSVVIEAIHTGNRRVVAQAVALGDPIVKRENLSRNQRNLLAALAIKL